MGTETQVQILDPAVYILQGYIPKGKIMDQTILKPNKRRRGWLNLV